MAGLPDATALIRASNRKLAGDLRKSRRMFDRSFKKTGKNINRSLRGALAPLGVGLGVAGLAAIGKQVLDFEESLVRLQIQARKTDAPEFLADLRAETIALAKATGKNRQEIIAGNTALVNLLGHTATTSERMEVLARTSTATGATMEDLAGIAFKLDTAFGITSGKDLEAALDALTFAGQETSIPLEKMGLLLAKTAPLFTKFGAGGVDAAADLGAFLQVVQKVGTAATPEEVATQFASFVRALEKQQKRIKKLTGVDVFEIVGGVRQLKAPRAIFDELAKSQKVLSDKSVLTLAFGRGEAADFATAILKGREEFEKLAAGSKTAGGTIKRDFKAFMESPAGRVKIAFNDMKEALAAAFTPERIEKFADVMEVVADILEVLIENAGIFIAVWAAFKIGALIAGFAAMAGSMSAAASAAAITATAVATTGGIATTTAAATTAMSLNSAATLGNFGKMVGPLAAVGVGAFLLGQALDEALGISDALAASLEDVAEDVARKALVFQTLLLEAGGTQLAPEARAARARAITAGVRPRSFPSAPGGGPVGPTAAPAEAPAEAGAPVVTALPAAPAAAQRVDVSVTVDQQGMLRAAETEESKARRSTQ